MGTSNQRKTLIQKTIARALQLRIVRAGLLYGEHRGSSLADSVTYRALFSVFAGVLLGFSVAALWLGENPEAMSALTQALDRVIPGLTEVINPASIDAPTGFTVAGSLALLGLIGAAIGAIASLRIAIRVLADETRGDGFFLWVIARNLLVAITFGGLLALAAALSAMSSLGVEMLGSWIGISATGVTEVLTRTVGIAIVLVIDTVAIAIIFQLLSGVKAPARALWSGAILGGVGLTVLQELSTLFVRGATANPLLATFSTLIALLIWFNLSSQVILLACSYIVVATAEANDRVRERFGATTLVQHRRRRAEDAYHAAARDLREAQEAEHEEQSKAQK